MDLEPRILTAFLIIGVMAVVCIPTALLTLRRRHRNKLRRRGIKRYGH
ncbi:hypothetical protein [Sphingomonas sp. EC-HK361]|nr:hypothetical protein [Sphingomonas sp. EC-HK361]